MRREKTGEADRPVRIEVDNRDRLIGFGDGL